MTVLRDARSYDVEFVQYLISAGADVNNVDIWGRTYLMECVSCGSVQHVELLLSKDVEINHRDECGQTALHRASCNYRELPEIVKLLISHGADINALDKELCTPLHLAIKANKFVITNLLLDAGAAVDIMNEKGETPLSMAKKCGWLAMFQVKRTKK